MQPDSSAVAPGASPPHTGGPMSPEEFRAMYLETLRRKHLEARQREQQGLPQNPHARPRPQETSFPVPPPFAGEHHRAADGEHVRHHPSRHNERQAHPQQQQGRPGDAHTEDGGAANAAEERRGWWLQFGHLLFRQAMGVAFQIALAAFVFTQGDYGWAFWRLFAILLSAKVTLAVLGRLQFKRVRQEDENDVRAEEHRVLLTGWRKVWYIIWKSFVTFFVSLHPSFQVEALEMELRMDGIDPRAAAHDRDPLRQNAPLAE